MIIISRSDKFKKEYRKYYRKEFCSVEKFIEEHFNIELDDAKNWLKEIIL